MLSIFIDKKTEVQKELTCQKSHLITRKLTIYVMNSEPLLFLLQIFIAMSSVTFYLAWDAQ